MKKDFNLTEKRIKALHYIAAHPGCTVGAVAQEILAGHRKRGLWAQQATRAGAGYCIKLVDAGLLNVRYAEVGWGVVTLTPPGRKMLMDLKYWPTLRTAFEHIAYDNGMINREHAQEDVLQEMFKRVVHFGPGLLAVAERELAALTPEALEDACCGGSPHEDLTKTTDKILDVAFDG